MACGSFSVGRAGELFALSDRHSLAFVEKLCADAEFLVLVGAVFGSRFADNSPVVAAVLYKLGLCEYAVVSDVEGFFYDKSDVAVYACALVPPAFGSHSVDVNCDNVGSVAEECAVRYVYVKRSVSRERASHERAVEIYARRDCHSLEREHNVLAVVFSRELEGLAVPCVVSGLVAVGDEVFGFEFRLCEVVVRDVHHSPRAVVKCKRWNAALLSCL